MKASKIIILGLLTLMLTACGDKSDLENHKLVGFYSGHWDTISIASTEINIAAALDKDVLEFSLSILNTHSMEIQSDTEFTIAPFEENLHNYEISGELIGDTLYLENNWKRIDDASLFGLRTGKFVKVE